MGKPNPIPCTFQARTGQGQQGPQGQQGQRSNPLAPSCSHTPLTPLQLDNIMTPFKDLRNDGAYFNDLLERPKYNAIPQPDLLQELRPLQQLQAVNFAGVTVLVGLLYNVPHKSNTLFPKK